MSDGHEDRETRDSDASSPTSRRAPVCPSGDVWRATIDTARTDTERARWRRDAFAAEHREGASP